ncbi:MAG: hypothetical protein ACOCRO_03750 [Halanaerobiales bacterium]
MLTKKNYISRSENFQKQFMYRNDKARDFYLVRDVDFSFDREISKIKISSSRQLFSPLINRTNKFSSKLK